MSNLTAFLSRLRESSSLPCMDCGDGRYLYTDLLNEISRWQSRLEESQVVPGAVIGVRASCTLYSAAALFALMERGSIAALIPNSGDTHRYLHDAHATALLDLSTDGQHKLTSLGRPSTHPLIERLRSDGQGGLVVFTSGSTGRPKAALHSAERFLQKFSSRCRQYRTLMFLVFDHIAGLDTMFYTLAAGGVIIPAERRDPRSILELIESRSVEVLPTSPSFLRMLCAFADIEKYDLSSLRIITYGSELMDATTISRVKSLLPHVEILQKYGTTETGSPRSDSRDGNSLWIKFKAAGCETKVVDDILWIRDDGAVLGYLNAPSPISDEGWYCTGDLVDVDGDWLRFRGRVSDLINVAGEKVAPAEVEEVILELDFVSNSVVRGEPHAILGEVVTAEASLLRKLPDSREFAARIREHCRRRLPAYKVPVKIEIVDDVALSQRQKLKRRTQS